MKIGIMTFHYVDNYGSVLQAYALQTYLEKLGHDVFFIDCENYLHEKTSSLVERVVRKSRVFIATPQSVVRFIMRRLNKTRNHKDFERFRENFLKIDKSKRYCRTDELREYPPVCNAYIVGSDQMWNAETFGEPGEEIACYFLDFGDDETLKIAYASSFGVESLDGYRPELVEMMSRCLKTFDAISVREQDGLVLLEQLGVSDAKWVPDPTLLLATADWDKLIPKKQQSNDYVFNYVLSDSYFMTQVCKFTQKYTRLPIKTSPDTLWSYVYPLDWMEMLRDSEFVLTDSFHGTVFSVIFQKNLIVVPRQRGIVAGSINRISSLLSRFGLEDRILWEYDEEKIKRLIDTPIDWTPVEKELSAWREEAREFLVSALKKN